MKTFSDSGRFRLCHGFFTENVDSLNGQGCQMVYFDTKNSNLGKFWRALESKMWVYFIPIWNILLQLGKFYGNLVHFSCFGLLYQEKAGNLGQQSNQNRY
jgi:hypothetical protein